MWPRSRRWSQFSTIHRLPSHLARRPRRRTRRASLGAFRNNLDSRGLDESGRNAPIQFVFAGKAHPRDDEDKRFIQQIIELSRDPRFAGRLVFVEDYDMNVARHFVQGVDLWLNTPLRPLEASGTSGQKVAVNGGLNFSTLDGWWAEAYDGHNGFAIGAGSVHADGAIQWSRDAASLYDVLETEVAPLFVDLDAAGLPARTRATCRRPAG